MTLRRTITHPSVPLVQRETILLFFCPVQPFSPLTRAEGCPTAAASRKRVTPSMKCCSRDGIGVASLRGVGSHGRGRKWLWGKWVRPRRLKQAGLGVLKGTLKVVRDPLRNRFTHTHRSSGVVLGLILGVHPIKIDRHGRKASPDLIECVRLCVIGAARVALLGALMGAGTMCNPC
eukprot:scaffold36182_cov30-Prasinocladus_malaysianus.AAC.1